MSRSTQSVEVLRFDATSARCDVLTFKEGLLSAMAHDLRIAVTKFAVEIDLRAGGVQGWFDARSLRVVSAVRDGEDAPDLLTAANRREIEGNISRDVLAADRHRDITFASARIQARPTGLLITGMLSLRGAERRINVAVRLTDGHLAAEARLHQPDFGIRPYSALFGALKVQADVVVRLSQPVPEAQG